MRKTLATLFAAFILIGTAGPALADAPNPTQLCGPLPTNTCPTPPTPPAPCSPTSATCLPDCTATAQGTRVVTDNLAETVLRQGQRIDRQHAKIVHQRHLIRALRAALAHQ